MGRRPSSAGAGDIGNKSIAGIPEHIRSVGPDAHKDTATALNRVPRIW